MPLESARRGARGLGPARKWHPRAASPAVQQLENVASGAHQEYCVLTDLIDHLEEDKEYEQYCRPFCASRHRYGVPARVTRD